MSNYTTLLNIHTNILVDNLTFQGNVFEHF